MSKFLPTTPAELEILAWDNPDIIIISGDAYIDHPSFGTALIGRWLQFLGFRVAVLPQPDWRNDEEFMSLGKPGLFFGITAGNMDSMVNHYTAQRKLRSYDAYSPEGKTGLRPDRAAIVYSQQVKRLFSDVPIILGGLEASLRRIPHYDFWSNKIRNSILFDSRADMIVYGMAEIPLQELTHRLAEGENLGEIQDVNGTVVSTRLQDNDGLELPEFHKDFTPDDFHRMSCIFYSNYTKTILYQKFSQRYLRHNIPARNLTQKEMDLVYDLPFTRQPHPRYTGKRITAFEQIKNSLTSHRGCFGGCSFCTLTLHQGRKISSRSIRSLGKEAEKLGKMPYFKGTISDVGGPTANMYGQYCKKEGDEKCLRDSCLFPDICPYLETSHRQQLLMLDELNNIEGVKHIFIASGIRFDLALRDERYIRELAVKYTGGLLKLAPEHYSNKVLQV
ncbi:MAG: YgiQ family radical SAM protein, partial [Candidatus Cloacimonetes bacterium]|nr:YgiQ family radical SAM protein [Candidatus Cloacimonadota bacterium]